MFKKVAIIGSGVMGSGIAAQIANNGIEILLYDLENEFGLIAQKSIDKLLASKPSGLVHPSIASLISAQSLEKNLDKLMDCDLVIEAITENLPIKQKFYLAASEFLKKDAILASNTSTFQLSQLKLDMPLELASRLVICHFFNPPRLMRLLEFIPGDLEETIKRKLVDFLTHKIGKTVIICEDSPGFIANRLGCYLMELVLQKAILEKRNIVEIDYIFSNYLGFPSTGIFGLYDLIGLDVMGFIANSLKSSLSPEDDFIKICQEIPQMQKMVKDGFSGRKGKGGFYKLEIDEYGKKNKYNLNLSSFEYEQLKPVKLEYNDLSGLLNSKSEISEFIENILSRFFSYVLSIHPEISKNIYDIDKAMQLGFGWKYGPFELMERSNFVPEFFQEKFRNLSIDVKKFGIKPTSLRKYIEKTENAEMKASNDWKIWKLKENKICFEIQSKMNVLNEDIFHGLSDAIDIAEQNNADLIIYSDSANFSAGANLKLFHEYLAAKNLSKVEDLLELGQQTFLKLKYAKVAAISCARGVALGGGCEILLHSDFIVAHQELSAGLVECSVGLIPGWGGVKEMILNIDSEDEIKTYLTSILLQYKSSSALDFAIHYNQKNLISLAHIDDLLNYALENNFEKKLYKNTYVNISKSLDLANPAYSPEIQLIAKELQKRLIGNLTEENLLKIERDIFLLLLQTEYAQKKISEFA